MQKSAISVKRLFNGVVSGMKAVCKTTKAWIVARSGVYDPTFADARLFHDELKRSAPAMAVKSAGTFLLVDIDGRCIYWPGEFSTSDLPWLYSEIYAPFEHNPSSYDHPLAGIRAGDWVIDAGACEGFFTRRALEGGAARVISVEPIPALLETLALTFAAEMACGCVSLAGVALSKQAGSAMLNTDLNHACDSSLGGCHDGGSGSIPVEALDELVAEYSLEGSGLIKMDIEGAEMDALKGATHILATLQPRLAIAVYHGYMNAAECRDIVLAANPAYTVEFRGMYGYYHPPRPYMVFAW